MLIAALVLTLVAAIIFAVEFVRTTWTSFTALGLAFVAAGLAAFIYWSGDLAGKF